MVYYGESFYLKTISGAGGEVREIYWKAFEEMCGPWEGGGDVRGGGGDMKKDEKKGVGE